MGPSSPDAAVRRCGCLGAPRQAGGGPAQMPDGPPATDHVTGHTGAAEGAVAALELSLHGGTQTRPADSFRLVTEAATKKLLT